MLIFLQIAFAAISLELGYFSYASIKYDNPDSDWADDYHKYDKYEKEKQIVRIMSRFKYTQSFIGTGIYLIILIQVFNWFPGRLIH